MMVLLILQLMLEFISNNIFCFLLNGICISGAHCICNGKAPTYSGIVPTMNVAIQLTVTAAYGCNCASTHWTHGETSKSTYYRNGNPAFQMV